MTNLIRRAALAALLATALPATVSAQGDAAYPEKPVRIVVPYTPGGFNDTMGRLFGRKLQEALGQPFNVDNKPGAGTVLGTDVAAKSPGDGYTLLVQGFPLVANQHLMARLPYDTKKGFVGVILGGYTPNVLLVNSASPVKTMKELVEASKKAGGRR